MSATCPLSVITSACLFQLHSIRLVCFLDTKEYNPSQTIDVNLCLIHSWLIQLLRVYNKVQIENMRCVRDHFLFKSLFFTN